MLEGSSPIDSCVDYVARNPEAFTDTWWGIRSLKVWEKVYAYTPSYVNTTSVESLAVEETPQSIPLSAGGVTSLGKSRVSTATTKKYSHTPRPTKKKPKSTRKVPHPTKILTSQHKKNSKHTVTSLSYSTSTSTDADELLTTKTISSISTTLTTFESPTSSIDLLSNLSDDILVAKPDIEIDVGSKSPDILSDEDVAPSDPGAPKDSVSSFNPTTIEDYFPEEGSKAFKALDPTQEEISPTLAANPASFSGTLDSVAIGKSAFSKFHDTSRLPNPLDWEVSYPTTPKDPVNNIGTFSPVGGASSLNQPPNNSPVIGNSNTNIAPNSLSVGAAVPAVNLPASNLWEALGDNIQDQLLALANNLPTAPATAPTIPVDLVQDSGLPASDITTPVAALDKADTSQVIGALLGFLDDATKQKLADLAHITPSGAIDGENVLNQYLEKRKLDQEGPGSEDPGFLTNELFSTICPELSFGSNSSKNPPTDLKNLVGNSEVDLSRLRNELEAQSAKLQQCIWNLSNFARTLEPSDSELRARQESPSLTGNADFDQYLQDKGKSKMWKWNYGILSKEQREEWNKAAEANAAQDLENEVAVPIHNPQLLSYDGEGEEDTDGGIDTDNSSSEVDAHPLSTDAIASEPETAAITISAKDQILAYLDLIHNITFAIAKLEKANLSQADAPSVSNLQSRNHAREFHQSKDDPIITKDEDIDSFSPIPIELLGEHGTLDPYGMLGPQVPKHPNTIAAPNGEDALPDESEEAEEEGSFDDLADSSEEDTSPQLQQLPPLDPFGQLGPQVASPNDASNEGAESPALNPSSAPSTSEDELEDSSESESSLELDNIPELDPFGQAPDTLDPAYSPVPNETNDKLTPSENGQWPPPPQVLDPRKKKYKPLPKHISDLFNPPAADEWSPSSLQTLSDSSEDEPSAELKNIPSLDPYGQLGPQINGINSGGNGESGSSHTSENLQSSSEDALSPELAKLPALDPFGMLGPQIPDSSDGGNYKHERSENGLTRDVVSASAGIFRSGMEDQMSNHGHAYGYGGDDDETIEILEDLAAGYDGPLFHTDVDDGGYDASFTNGDDDFVHGIEWMFPYLPHDGEYQEETGAKGIPMHADENAEIWND